jgi:hypothetical protein
VISAIGEEKAKCYDRKGASVPRGRHFEWEGHASQRPESRPNIRPRRLQQPNLPESVNRGVTSSLYKGAPESLRSVAKQTQARRPRVSLQTKGDRIVLSVRDAGVGFPIRFARRFARVNARPQMAIDPIKFPPRWKNISSAPGGRAPITKATSHGLRVRIWPKPANAFQ